MSCRHTSCRTHFRHTSRHTTCHVDTHLGTRHVVVAKSDILGVPCFGMQVCCKTGRWSPTSYTKGPSNDTFARGLHFSSLCHFIYIRILGSGTPQIAKMAQKQLKMAKNGISDPQLAKKGGVKNRRSGVVSLFSLCNRLVFLTIKVRQNEKLSLLDSFRHFVILIYIGILGLGPPPDPVLGHFWAILGHSEPF